MLIDLEVCKQQHTSQHRFGINSELPAYPALGNHKEKKLNLLKLRNITTLLYKSLYFVMSRQSLVMLMLGLMLVVVQSAAAGNSQRHPVPISYDDSISVDDSISSEDSDSDSNENNNDLLMLLMLSGGQFVQSSLVVMTVAAALGILAAHGLLTSSLHN